MNPSQPGDTIGIDFNNIGGAIPPHTDAQQWNDLPADIRHHLATELKSRHQRHQRQCIRNWLYAVAEPE